MNPRFFHSPILPFFILLISINYGYAQLEVSFKDLSPSVIWLHESAPKSLLISVECKLNNTPLPNATVLGTIYGGPGLPEITNFQLIHDDVQTGIYKYSLSLDESHPIGEYKAVVSCDYENYTKSTAETYFETKKLTLEIVGEDQIEAYKGGELELDVIFKKYDKTHQNGALITPSRNSFSVYVVSQDTETQLNLAEDVDPWKTQDNTQRIRVLIPLSDPPKSGRIYTLKVVGEEEGISLSSQRENFIKINSALKMKINDKIKCQIDSVCKKDLIADVIYYGGSINTFTKDNFHAVIVPEDRVINIDGITCTKSTETCKLTLTIPNLEAGSYQIGIKVKADGYEYTEWVPLDIVLSLSGEILDATGGTVSSILTLENEDTGKVEQITTDSFGKYSIDVLPGNYKIELKFPGLIAKLHNVSLNEDTISSFGGNSIRYDTFSGFTGIKGLKVAKIVVLEFALPFKDGSISIPYDDSKVYDETKLEVYVCHNWNFGARTCAGSWEKLQSNIHTTRNMVEFNINELSAFIIGERKSLHFHTLSVNKEECHLGETLFLTGKVLDSDGQEVDEVLIKFSFPTFNISSLTITTGDGVFNGVITTPFKEGVHRLVVTAEKDPFISANNSKMIRLTKSQDISLIVPDMGTAFLNKPSDIEFSVINTGQVNLTDVRLYISGISNEWYELTPIKINSLGINEEKKVNMKLLFTSEKCGEKCDQYYLVNVNVKAKTESGDEIEKGQSFTLKILLPQEPEKKGTSIFSRITGKVTLTSVKGMLDYMLLMILGGAAIIIAIFMKKKVKKKITFREGYDNRNF